MDSDTKNTSEKLWLVVKSMRPAKGVKLNEGDIIKLGRLKFRIRKINSPGQSSASLNSPRANMDLDIVETP